MKLIVGLGNPGAEYLRTRHNIGRVVVERLSRCWGIALERTFCRARVGEGLWGRERLALALPETFMNASGEAVGCLIRHWRLPKTSCLVVCDDVALPLGALRLRAQGSQGGHLGLASVLEETHTQRMARLRVGIRGESVGPDVKDYVLSRFESSERALLEKGIAAALQACEVWVKEGLTAAMNRFNRKLKRVG